MDIELGTFVSIRPELADLCIIQVLVSLSALLSLCIQQLSPGKVQASPLLSDGVNGVEL